MHQVMSRKTRNSAIIKDFEMYPKMIIYYVLRSKEGGYLVPGKLISFLFEATGMLPMYNHRLVHPIPIPHDVWVDPRQYSNLDELLGRWSGQLRSL